MQSETDQRIARMMQQMDYMAGELETTYGPTSKTTCTVAKDIISQVQQGLTACRVASWMDKEKAQLKGMLDKLRQGVRMRDDPIGVPDAEAFDFVLTFEHFIVIEHDEDLQWDFFQTLRQNDEKLKRIFISIDAAVAETFPDGLEWSQATMLASATRLGQILISASHWKK